ncbi:ABC transporter permease [Enterococcus sp. LJL128]
MDNVLAAELRKVKKNRMIGIGFLIVCAVPVLFILKSLLIDETLFSYQEWMQGISMFLYMIFPVISGLVITQLIQKEYEEKTVINNLTAPVKRSYFIAAKLIVWAIWYLLTLASTVLITIIGSFLFYDSSIVSQGISLVWTGLVKTGAFSFAAFMPVLWIAVKQRTLFYPAILFTLLFTGLQVAGSQISLEMLPLGSVVPWSAVSILQLIDDGSIYWYVCLASIVISGLLGCLLAIWTFKRQDL